MGHCWRRLGPFRAKTNENHMEMWRNPTVSFKVQEILADCEGLYPLNFRWEVMDGGRHVGNGAGQENDRAEGQWLFHYSFPQVFFPPTYSVHPSRNWLACLLQESFLGKCNNPSFLYKSLGISYLTPLWHLLFLHYNLFSISNILLLN